MKDSSPNRFIRKQPAERPAKRDRSPDESGSGRSKRTRCDDSQDGGKSSDNQDKRIVVESGQAEKVDLTLRRPLLAANRRPRTSSMATVFRSPRARSSAAVSSSSRSTPTSRRSASSHHARARTTVAVEQDAEYNRQEELAKMIDEKFDHVIFVDLDNWINFFGKLRMSLPSKAFVWGFWGKLTAWRKPHHNRYFQELVNSGRFEGTEAGREKDAADFAMVLKIGQMDKDIKKRDIGFTIVTGDRGFTQVKEDFLKLKRNLNVINPHILNRSNYYSIDDALRSHCRRSQSMEPKPRSHALDSNWTRDNWNQRNW